MSNLIGNAINYNRERGSVKVRIEMIKTAEAQKFWQVAVHDTGIGIPRDAINRVFERFYRVDKARSRERGGTGLGLSIVKHIALCHSASIHVESELGVGSTFYLRFSPVQNTNDAQQSKN
jgi:signal transduction histidine kinase